MDPTTPKYRKSSFRTKLLLGALTAQGGHPSQSVFALARHKPIMETKRNIAITDYQMITSHSDN